MCSSREIEMEYVTEPARQVPVRYSADVCVCGGSCTGLFAAIRAARMGMKVLVIEASNRLGGTATNGLVNVWHSLMDDTYSYPVIAGLTLETEKRMEKAGRIGYAQDDASIGARLDPVYLSFLLDDMAREEGVDVLFHTRYAGLVTENKRISHICIDNIDGMSAVKADFYIDATGDGCLCRDIGMEGRRAALPQPPSACFLMTGDSADEDMASLLAEHGAEFGLTDDWGWYGSVPGHDGLYMRADNHVFGADCATANGLSRAETEGRRTAFALEKLLDTYGKRKHRIVNLCSHVGVREAERYRTAYTMTDDDLLLTRRFDDAILQGTYRLDRHHQEDNGITFRYINGEYVTYYGKGEREVRGNWRKERGITQQAGHFYSMPFKTLVQDRAANFCPAGRMIGCEDGAYGALRVMVNCNQMGEAAGTVAAMCLREKRDIWDIDGRRLKEELNRGGSCLR